MHPTHLKKCKRLPVSAWRTSVCISTILLPLMAKFPYLKRTKETEVRRHHVTWTEYTWSVTKCDIMLLRRVAFTRSQSDRRRYSEAKYNSVNQPLLWRVAQHTASTALCQPYFQVVCPIFTERCLNYWVGVAKKLHLARSKYQVPFLL
jgi:hypothetical protein